MKQIITIQHTQSIHHTNGMVGSWTDWDLSQLGIQQAHSIGRKLSKELEGTKQTVYCSSLLRAKHTAEIVSDYLNVTPIVKDELMECNLGKAVGKSVEWLKQNIECHIKTVDDRCFADAESKRDVYLRLKPFYEEILNSTDDNIIVVSHGGTLSIFNALWLGLDIEMLNNIDLFGQAGGVSFFTENEDGKHIIRRLSDRSYV